MEGIKWRGIMLAPGLVLCIYLLLLCARMIDPAAFGDENGYLTAAVLQMMIFLLPAAIYCRLRGGKFRSHLRLRLFGLDQILLLAAAVMVMVCGSLLIGFIADGASLPGGNFTLYDTFTSPTADGVGNVLYVMLAYAFLPAICEEFVFRALLCAEFEVNGIPAAAVVSALFFAMLHFDLAQFPLYFFSGILLAMVLYATRSVLGPILVHAGYNLFCLFGRPYVSEFYSRTGSAELFIFLVILLLLLVLILFFSEASRTYRLYARRGVPSPHHRVRTKQERAAMPFLEALVTPLGLVCALFYLVVVIAS